jgi:hypothetical protein
MFVEDAQGGLIYRRHGTLSGGRAPGTRIGAQWGEQNYRVLFDDIPIEAPWPLRVRFEASGEGAVWIDNVQLFDLSFPAAPSGVRSQPNEQRELYKIILEARKALDEGAYSDCLESLDGYWPTFLTAHVQAPIPQVAESPPGDADRADVREAKSQSVPDRIKQLVPRIWK